MYHLVTWKLPHPGWTRPVWLIVVAITLAGCNSNGSAERDNGADDRPSPGPLMVEVEEGVVSAHPASAHRVVIIPGEAAIPCLLGWRARVPRTGVQRASGRRVLV